jgi:hypothetical protein
LKNKKEKKENFQFSFLGAAQQDIGRRPGLEGNVVMGK